MKVVFRNYIIRGKSCMSQMVVGHKVVPSSSTRCFEVSDSELVIFSLYKCSFLFNTSCSTT